MEKLKLGPLTSKLLNEAKWKNQDKYPAWQSYADECERLLHFATQRDQWDRFWSKLTADNTRQRDSALNELRVAFHFEDNSFSIVNWEPIGNQAMEGEFLIQGTSGIQTFVEVKSPGWQGELFRFKSPSELPEAQQKYALDRKEKPKYIDLEGGPFSPAEGIQFAIKKAYPKFTSNTPNVLVIADDLFVSLEHGTEMRSQIALYDKDGCFAGPEYEKLGGVGIFWASNNLEKYWYEMKLFLNPHSLQSTALPEDMRRAFRG